jgi:hypothetical protein
MTQLRWVWLCNASPWYTFAIAASELKMLVTCFAAEAITSTMSFHSAEVLFIHIATRKPRSLSPAGAKRTEVSANGSDVRALSNADDRRQKTAFRGMRILEHPWYSTCVQPVYDPDSRTKTSAANTKLSKIMRSNTFSTPCELSISYYTSPVSGRGEAATSRCQHGGN